MSDRVQAEIHHPGANVTEVVRDGDTPAEKIDVGTALDQLVAQRKAEHPEWYAEEQSETPNIEETTQEAAPAEEEPEPEQDEQTGGEAHTDQEPESKALKRILAREAKLREDRETFEAEIDEWKEYLLEFEQAKKSATIDPISYLKTLGFSQENLIDLAKAAYYESLGDMAPNEYRGQKESLALKREVEQLKARLEAKEKQPEAAPETNEALVAYQNELLEATKSFDVEQYPSVARIVDSYSEMTVAADMLAVAEEYAQQKGGVGAPLTPEQCLMEVEHRYNQMLSKLTPQVAQEPAQQEVQKPKRNTTLSNSMSSNIPPERTITEDMTYEEIADLARSRFRKALVED